MSKIIYKAASDSDFFVSLLWRSLCVVAIGYLCLQYNENPPVITGCCLFLLLCLLFIGNDEITVYEDKLVQADTSVMTFLFKKRKRQFDMAGIASASLPDNEPPNLLETGLLAGLAAFLIAVLPKGRRRYTNQATFYLDMKDGDMITINTDVGADEVNMIVRKVNSLVSSR